MIILIYIIIYMTQFNVSLTFFPQTKINVPNTCKECNIDLIHNIPLKSFQHCKTCI